MPVLADPQGYPLTASRPETASLLDEAVTAYLGARTDARGRLDRLLEADPGCLLGRALDGYLLMCATETNTKQGIDRLVDALPR